MKKLIPAYILSFVISFMLFIIEPITLYVNNTIDFNFNFVSILRPMLLLFLGVFVGLSLIYTIIYYINRKFSNKLGFFNVIMIISYILFIFFYIIGNYMSGNLPRLDGTTPDWTIYDTENTIAIVILIILVGSYVFACIKFKFDKVINVSKYISLAIFVMLFTGFIPSLTNNSLYDEKKVYYISDDNINNISTNKNFFILLIDAVDSREFMKAVNNSDNKEAFSDFTYYPDAMALYPFTRDTIPYLLSGKQNLNEEDFQDYVNLVMDESPLIDKLVENKYDINIYETDYLWNTEKSKVTLNAKEYNSTFSTMCYAKNEIKYVAFKYLPYFAKKYSRVDNFNLNRCKVEYSDGLFSSDDLDYYNSLKENINIVENNNFSFIHIDGAHVPFDYDEELNKIEEGTYEQKVKASLKIVNSFISRLKENNLYDNSIIIVMADHGFNGENLIGRQNPVLFIKGFNEHHKMLTSDKAVHYDDLMEAYSMLLDEKLSTDLFPNVLSERIRTIILYGYLFEDHKEEYQTAGHAWETDNWVKTGKVYDR